MAISLLAKGKKVLLVGRTESNLASTCSEIGAQGYYVLDTGDIPSIPSFISRITTDHPDLDCIINNAGVQQPFEVTPRSGYRFDLTKADKEVDINIRGPVHLTGGLIEHFSKLPNGGVVMNVSSVLGFVPFSLVNPIYNGTKAFLHSFTLTIRTQIAKSEEMKGKIRVIEIVPPTVETDLHRDRKNPDDNKKHGGNKETLSIEEFMKGLEEGWEDGRETIGVGRGKDIVAAWEGSMGSVFAERTGT